MKRVREIKRAFRYEIAGTNLINKISEKRNFLTYFETMHSDWLFQNRLIRYYTLKFAFDMDSRNGPFL